MSDMQNQLIRAGYNKRQANAIISATPTIIVDSGAVAMPLEKVVLRASSFFHYPAHDDVADWTVIAHEDPTPTLELHFDEEGHFHPVPEGNFTITQEIDLGWATGAPASVELNFDGYFDGYRIVTPVIPAGLTMAMAGVDGHWTSPFIWLPAWGADDDDSHYCTCRLAYGANCAQPTRNGAPGQIPTVDVIMMRWS